MMSCPQDEDEVWQRHWAEVPFVAFDLEGAGVQAGQPEGIVELAAFLIERGQFTGEKLETLVNPGRKISSMASRVHGIRDADVIGAPTIAVIAPKLREIIDRRVFVAHNARVDWTLLAKLCPGLRPLCIIDTLKLARVWYPDLPSKSLLSMIEHLDVSDSLRNVRSKQHRAGYDAMAAGSVLMAMLKDKTTSTFTLRELSALAGVIGSSAPANLTLEL